MLLLIYHVIVESFENGWYQVTFKNDTFEIITITVTEIVLIQVSFLPLRLNKKTKIKPRNDMAPSYRSKFSSSLNQGSDFSVALVLELCITSLCLGKVKVFPMMLACQSYLTFNVLMTAVIEFLVFLTGLNGWIFLYELRGCGIITVTSI